MLVPLLDLFAALMMQVPPSDELRLCYSEAEAGVRFLYEVRKELFRSPGVVETHEIVETARFFGSEMKLSKPLLRKEFNQYVCFKTSILGLSLFLQILHYIYFSCLLTINFVYQSDYFEMKPKQRIGNPR